MENKEQNKCPDCKKAYDSTLRQLIILPCCDEICLTCYEKLLQPQDDKLACPECQEEIKIPLKFKTKITKIKENLPELIPGLNIFCDAHDNCQGDFYCKQHKIFACFKCALNGHGDHKEQICDVKFGDISSYCDRVLNKLISFKNRIESAIDEVQKLKIMELSYKSAQFIELINEISSILTPHLKTKQELNDLQFCLDEQILKDAVDPLQFDEVSQKTFNITAKEQRHLKEWIGGNPKFELLYRSGRDELTAGKFHQLCDDKGPSISIIKSDQGKIFGGYASISWKSNGSWQIDNKAFLFSLTNLTKHSQEKNLKQTIYHDSKQFCSFGNDIIIYNAPTKSISNLFGNTYKLPDGLKYGSEEAINYLTGKGQFLPTDIEVYKVIFQ